MANDRPLLIEGYASVFGHADAEGDIVRAGAFARALRIGQAFPMLLQHRSGAIAGQWSRIVEDGYGLFVRGRIESPHAAGLVQEGVNGLSIGFRPRLWRARVPGGRELIDIELVEISLVASPAQDRARFRVLGLQNKQAA